jgi:hypothetical protein
MTTTPILRIPIQRVTLGHRLRVGSASFEATAGHFDDTRVIVRVLKPGRTAALTLESDDEESGLFWDDGELGLIEFTPEQISTVYAALGTKSVCRITLEGDEPLVELDLLAEFEIVIYP